MQSLFKAFEEFIAEFSARRLTATILLVGVLVGSFIIVDRYSPYFTMSRLERATALLDQLSASQSPAEDKELNDLRVSIVRQLRNQVEPRPWTEHSTPGRLNGSPSWRFVAGIVPWSLFAVFFGISSRKDPSVLSGVFASVLLALLFGLLAVSVIPDDWATWPLLAGYAVFSFVFPVAGIMTWQSRLAARRTAAARDATGRSESGH